MAQALTKNRAHFRPYSVTRDYKLFAKEKDTTKSEVIAEISFVTPGLNHTIGNIRASRCRSPA
jgi:hypothetical protein